MMKSALVMIQRTILQVSRSSLMMFSFPAWFCFLQPFTAHKKYEDVWSRCLISNLVLIPLSAFGLTVLHWNSFSPAPLFLLYFWSKSHKKKMLRGSVHGKTKQPTPEHPPSPLPASPAVITDIKKLRGNHSVPPVCGFYCPLSTAPL